MYVESYFRLLHLLDTLVEGSFTAGLAVSVALLAFPERPVTSLLYCCHEVTGFLQLK
jgi:ABC-type uncharacterized transport system permease subunit